MEQASIFIVLDNDKNDMELFRKQLDEAAYAGARRGVMKKYEQDGLCDTWEMLADMVYPGGMKKLLKTAGESYREIGKIKCEWADRIGAYIQFERNQSPSFQYFIGQLRMRIG